MTSETTVYACALERVKVNNDHTHTNSHAHRPIAGLFRPDTVKTQLYNEPTQPGRTPDDTERRRRLR